MLAAAICLGLCCAAAGARLWWRYAITVVQRQQQSYSSRAWKQLRMLAYYQRYVTAYLKYLQQGKQGSGDPTIRQLDSQLDEAVILLFRRMAHAKLKELRASAAEAAKQPAQQQTWVGWLLGTGAKPAQQQAQVPDAAAGDLDTSMGVAEWNKLEDVLSEQAVRWDCCSSCVQCLHAYLLAIHVHDERCFEIKMSVLHEPSSCLTCHPAEVVWHGRVWLSQFPPFCAETTTCCCVTAGGTVRGPERVTFQGEVCAEGAGVSGHSRIAGCWGCTADAGLHGGGGHQGGAIPPDTGHRFQCVNGKQHLVHTSCRWLEIHSHTRGALTRLDAADSIHCTLVVCINQNFTMLH